MTEPAADPPSHDLQAKILIIEDQLVSMDAAEALLSSWPNLEVLKAYSGTEGIRVTQAERPDLVLLDMQLPDMSGLDVVRALSEMLSEKTTRVVLLTSHGFSLDVIKAMSLGAQEYWPKPLTPERVDEELLRLADLRRRPPRF
jgi:CheY-like chemotaxis protein